MFVVIAKLDNGSIECIAKSEKLADVVALKSKIELENRAYFLSMMEAAGAINSNVSREDFNGTEEEYQYFQSQLESQKAQYEQSIQENAPEYYGAELFIF